MLGGSLGVSSGGVLPASDVCALELWMAGEKAAPPPGNHKKQPQVGEDHPGLGFDLGFSSLNDRVRGEVPGGPKRLRDEGREAATMDAFVTVASTVVITTKDGTKIPFSEVRVDDRVQMIGRFLRPEKWLADEAGEPTPTLYAKRIKIKNR